MCTSVAFGLLPLPTWGRMNGGTKIGRRNAPCWAGARRCGRRGVGPAADGQSPAAPRLRAARRQRRRSVFVHGNGNSAALWINNIWRFEANGYTRNQMSAIDFSYPTRAATMKAPALPLLDRGADKGAGRLRREVRRNPSPQGGPGRPVARRQHDPQLPQQRRRGDSVSHAVLCGTPNKGIVMSDTVLTGSEFNGATPFLKELNGGPDDLIPGVELMAIRSDKNDKYAQPDGRYIGQAGKPTGVGYDASELRGARNVVLDGLDHREWRSTSSPSPAMTSSSPAGRRAPCSSPRSRAGAERPGHRHGRRHSTPTCR